ncbi:hypothetical protein R1flu_005981 [Riccia fluitans]|uniref:EGF-like domain-containing protein n=1 Tax=Riccia fluitans TaxID=41844 RepID=A0ABD1YUP9_9MARC
MKKQRQPFLPWDCYLTVARVGGEGAVVGLTTKQRKFLVEKQREDMGKRSGALRIAVILLLVVLQELPNSVAQSGACSGVNCQRGTCSSAFLGYTCDCQEGWGNILGLKFLPCGIPKNCHINLTCNGKAEGPAPALSPSAPSFQLPNLTSFNPCTLSLCGYGKCVKEENPGFLMAPYSCVCDLGNSNALNMSSGICLPDCNFLGGCPDLGIPLSGSSSPPPPSNVTFPPSAGRRVGGVATFLAAAAIGSTAWLFT